LKAALHPATLRHIKSEPAARFATHTTPVEAPHLSLRYPYFARHSMLPHLFVIEWVNATVG